MFDTPISIFYSRRIGQPSMMNSSEYRINTALKLMGNIDNGWSYGISQLLLADGHIQGHNFVSMIELKEKYENTR